MMGNITHYRVILFLIISGIIFLGIGDLIVKSVQSENNAQRANAFLKKFVEIGDPDIDVIKQMLVSKKFEALDELYESYYEQFQEDILYEAFLHYAYDLFDPGNGISVLYLDLWIKETNSYIAYAARGIYNNKKGYEARGSGWARDLSQRQFDSMLEFHRKAIEDLRIAIGKKPKLEVPLFPEVRGEEARQN